jgi:hypothetical protein
MKTKKLGTDTQTDRQKGNLIILITKIRRGYTDQIAR